MPKRRDSASAILRKGIEVTSADMLRVVAALAEAAAELKEESKECLHYST